MTVDKEKEKKLIYMNKLERKRGTFSRKKKNGLKITIMPQRIFLGKIQPQSKSAWICFKC